MSLRFFVLQIATSSISNIIGTVVGHPLDTIRVSTGEDNLCRLSVYAWFRKDWL